MSVSLKKLHANMDEAHQEIREYEKYKTECRHKSEKPMSILEYLKTQRK